MTQSKYSGAILKTATELAFNLQTEEGREAFLDYQLFYQNDDERHAKLVAASANSIYSSILKSKERKTKRIKKMEK